MNHTPGPWTTSNRLIEHDQPMIEIVGNDASMPTGRCSVAEVWIDTSNVELDEANARLIAAAPELLEALDEIVQWLNLIGGHQPPSWPEKARAAILKATGSDTI